MALFVNQEDTRTKLQKRIAEELAAKAKNKSTIEIDKDRPDGVDDSSYLKNTQQTTKFAWLWALLAVAIIAILVLLVVA